MEKGNNVRDLIFLCLVPISATAFGSICWAADRAMPVPGHVPTAFPPLVPPPHPYHCPLGMAPAATGPCQYLRQHLPHPPQLARTRPTSDPMGTHMVVVLPAPLCPRKDTTWFS